MKIAALLNILLLLFIQGGIYAQPDRSVNNLGVEKYENGKFSDAEVEFRKGIEVAPKSEISNFNLGTSYYKQQKYDDAIKFFNNALSESQSDNDKAKIYHNIGNSLLKNNKIQESIEAYKNALKLNPDDADTKYNLSYALELLKNQNKDQQNKNDKNQNDQNKKDQQQDKDQQNQNNKDQNKQNQQNPQPKDEQSKQDNTKQQQQPKEEKISKEEAQRILDALKNNEKDLQKKLRKIKGRTYKTDKDW